MLANGSNTPFAWNYLDGSDLKSLLGYPNGLTASWQYDANGQLLQVKNAFDVAAAPSPSQTSVISQYDYAYDAVGRRVACGKSGSAFAQDDTVAYGYNARSELTNAVAAVDSDYRYAYDFDDIGNRESSSERGTNSVYTANGLSQYTSVDDFAPQFDDDGNQTLIKTATGIWHVTYNGENRPILWTCLLSNNQTITNQTIISMSFDRMGRRVTKNDQRFIYDGYLQIANFELQTSNIKLQTFIWDPTEPVSTRPLVWGQCEGSTILNFEPSTLNFYTHDGNKNVSEVVGAHGDVSAHYEYVPFGALVAKTGDSAIGNPFRFSSEYADDALGLIYYNYRHYAPISGTWCSRDSLGEESSLHLALFCRNSSIARYDLLGLIVHPMFGFDTDWWLENNRPTRTQLEKDRDELESRLAASCPQGDEPIPTPWKSLCCKESCKKQAHELAWAIYEEVEKRAKNVLIGGRIGNSIVSLLLAWKIVTGHGQEIGQEVHSIAWSCTDWQLFVGDAFKEYKKKYPDGEGGLKSERCFNAKEAQGYIPLVYPFNILDIRIDVNLSLIGDPLMDVPLITFPAPGLYIPTRHQWEDIIPPDSSSPVQIDPWPSGGKRLFRK